MTKGEILISLVAGKTFCNEAILMEDENFVKEAKRLIKKGCYKTGMACFMVTASWQRKQYMGYSKAYYRNLSYRVFT